MDPVTKEVLDSANLQANPLELLTKIVAVTGNETIESNFTYDSKNYLISEQHKGIENGVAVDTYKKYYRDTTGKIVKVALKSKQDVDTVYTRTTYDDYYTNTLLYTLSQYQRQGQVIRDSVTYVYDGNGHIGIQKQYRQKATGDYGLFEQHEYSFSGRNLVVVKDFVDSSNSSNLVVAGVRQFSYDTRFNPLKLNNEAILIGRPEWASANNLISIDLENKLAPGDNYKVVSKLFYSISRKPVYGTSIKSPVGTVTQVTYFYK
ncbi:MAG: hypothetical protein LH478_09345 [Chitinophagaceae bacterium]|nr:hypothetical protein [Chitinophagaceae bacterium]